MISVKSEIKKYRDKDWLYEVYIEDGKDAVELGEICGVSAITISYWLDKFDISKQYNYRKEDWLQRKTEKGLLQEEIGNICGVSGNTISVWQDKYNITPNFSAKTHKEFKKELKSVLGEDYGDYEIVGKYQTRTEKILMKHNICGYEYKARPEVLLKGYGKCPVCFNAGSLDTKLFQRKVANLSDDEYTVLGECNNAHSKVSIRHNKCGHEWKITPSNFMTGHRCPKCANALRRCQLKRSNEEFKNEVDDLYGDEYSVIGEYKNANTKVLVCHNKCGFEYKIRPSTFLKKRREGQCPVCYSDSNLINTKSFKKKVQRLVGDEYTVLGEYDGARSKISIKHNKCGGKYDVRPYAFLMGRRCPHCALSKGEGMIAKFSRKQNLDFEPQVTFNECKGDNLLSFDFKYTNGENIVLIEFDGKQHYKPIDYFGGKKQWEKQVLRDRIKDEFVLSHNIPLLRVNYMDRDNGKLIGKVSKFLKDNNIL